MSPEDKVFGIELNWKRHWGAVECIRSPLPSTPRTKSSGPRVSMLTDASGVSEPMGEVSGTSWTWQRALARAQHTRRSQPHAFCRGQIVSHHDRADKQRVSPTIWHGVALSSATSPSSRGGGGCIDTGCGSKMQLSASMTHEGWVESALSNPPQCDTQTWPNKMSLRLSARCVCVFFFI